VLRLPAWLDPLWHIDYDVQSSLSVDAASAALRPRSGGLRGRSLSDGAVVLVRHGGFLNQFVRARASMRSAAGGTTVRIHIARPAMVTAFFVAGLLFFIVLPALQLVIAALLDRGRIVHFLVFLLAGIVIWAFVIGANYTSARSEARDLQRLINEALQVTS
jgi:hypothetical protein